jgi:hypothetical protein
MTLPELWQCPGASLRTAEIYRDLFLEPLAEKIQRIADTHTCYCAIQANRASIGM